MASHGPRADAIAEAADMSRETGYNNLWMICHAVICLYAALVTHYIMYISTNRLPPCICLRL